MLGEHPRIEAAVICSACRRRRPRSRPPPPGQMRTAAGRLRAAGTVGAGLDMGMAFLARESPTIFTAALPRGTSESPFVPGRSPSPSGVVAGGKVRVGALLRLLGARPSAPGLIHLGAVDGDLTPGRHRRGPGSGPGSILADSASTSRNHWYRAVSTTPGLRPSMHIRGRMVCVRRPTTCQVSLAWAYFYYAVDVFGAPGLTTRDHAQTVDDGHPVLSGFSHRMELGRARLGCATAGSRATRARRRGWRRRRWRSNGSVRPV